jgi:photosystem II stability/assembly factor-like uncharacterized protein
MTLRVLPFVTLLLCTCAPLSPVLDGGLLPVDPSPGPIDAGVTDGGLVDAGPVDAGRPDGGSGMALPDAGWRRLPTVAFNGKQDDVHFIDAQRGWYANGAGFVYRTTNGGESWQEVLRQPGTYWRALGFVDEQVGVLGNLGPNVFPGVTDPEPLYLTTNGGMTVTPVTSRGPKAEGICAVDVLRHPGGVLIHAAGRVQGPAHLMRSTDLGQTWTTTDLSASIAMVTDVKFLTPDVGFIAGGSSPDIASSRAVIIKTSNGGQTWTKVYESARGAELVWKLSVPSAQVAYATVQTYDGARAEQVVAKSTNGGDTWVELPLVREAGARQLGIGFVDESTGWVGTVRGGFQTTNGGATWERVSFGTAVNKVRVVPTASGFVAFAIGVEVFKLEVTR